MLTEEVLYDVAVLRRLLAERLIRAGVEVRLGAGVDALRRLGGGGFEVETNRGDVTPFDVLVNCSYAEINRLTAQLGHTIETRQYEYAAVPIMEIDWPVEASVTILDGPFVSLLPYGPRGQYLVAHVADQVIAREDTPLINPAWRDPETSPFASIDRQTWLRSYMDSCCEFLPDLRGASLKGFLQRPRMVVAGREDTDARRSFVTLHEPGYMSVSSGKIDHCIWVAEEVASRLMNSGQSEKSDLPTRAWRRP
jgi:glycine/D-amino acid oxidase-like deaminating enzyme